MGKANLRLADSALSPPVAFPQTGEGFSDGQALLGEFLVTTALCFTVCSVAFSKKQAGNSFFGRNVRPVGKGWEAVTVSVGSSCIRLTAPSTAQTQKQRYSTRGAARCVWCGAVRSPTAHGDKSEHADTRRCLPSYCRRPYARLALKQPRW